MRKLPVRHQPLPGRGHVFELDLARGSSRSVASHRSRHRHLAVADRDAVTPTATAAVTGAEATAVAALLTGAHFELTTTPTSG